MNPLGHPAHWSGHGKPSKAIPPGQRTSWRTGTSESVSALVQPLPEWNTSHLLQERREAIYESNKREPLGRAHIRGHSVPVQMVESGFRFGRVTDAHGHFSGQNGKDVIAPLEPQVDTTREHEQYVRSHYAFSPGEQMHRKYAWPTNVAKDANFRFGRAGGDDRAAKWAGRQDCVGNALFGGAWETDAQGCSEPSEKSPPPVPPGFAFGTPSKSSGAAGEAIWGTYTPQEQLPDRDLGKCMKEGRRNLAHEPQHAFGKPSGLPRALQRAVSVGALSQRPSRTPPCAGAWAAASGVVAATAARAGFDRDRAAFGAAGAVSGNEGSPDPRRVAFDGGAVSAECDATTESQLCERRRAYDAVGAAPRCYETPESKHGKRRRDPSSYDGGAAPAMSPDSFMTPEACSDFTKARCQNEVRALFQGAGCSLAPGEFAELWSAAANATPKAKAVGWRGGQEASLEAFAKVYAERKSAGVAKRIEVPAVGRLIA